MTQSTPDMPQWQDIEGTALARTVLAAFSGAVGMEPGQLSREDYDSSLETAIGRVRATGIIAAGGVFSDQTSEAFDSAFVALGKQSVTDAIDTIAGLPSAYQSEQASGTVGYSGNGLTPKVEEALIQDLTGEANPVTEAGKLSFAIRQYLVDQAPPQPDTYKPIFDNLQRLSKIAVQVFLPRES